MIFLVSDDIRYEDHNLIKNATISDLLGYFADKNVIGFDIETDGLDPHSCKILSYQLGNGVHQYVVDAVRYPITEIRSLLSDNTKTFVIQNAKFDLQFCYHNGIYPDKIWDTYLAEAVLHKGNKAVEKSLKSIVDRYFSIQLSKDVRGAIIYEGLSERVIRYCANDVAYLLDIKKVQEDMLAKKDLLVSMRLENTFVKVLAYVEYCGIKLDTQLWLDKVSREKELFDAAKQKLNDWIIENKIEKYIDFQMNLFSGEINSTINWSSSKQVADLFTSLGLDLTDEHGKTSVDASVLERQIDRHPLVPVYLEYKKYEKAVSTYGTNVLKHIHPVTGRIHTSFTQILDTGRLASGRLENAEGREGINLQNMPSDPETRRCFVAEEGNVFINADYSQQEQVVFANWVLDSNLLNFYRQNLGDMHSYIAKQIFPQLTHVELTDIKTHYKDLRQKAKSAGFAINYGGTGETIARNLNISREEGEKIYEAYMNAFPNIRRYFKTVTEEAIKTGYIQFNNITHSKYFIQDFEEFKTIEAKLSQPGFWDRYREEKLKNSKMFNEELFPLVQKYFKKKGEISRMAANYPIQGSSAEITKIACIYIFNYLKSHDLLGKVKICNIIHDEVIVECPESLSQEIADIVKTSMEKAGNIYCKLVPLKAEYNIAPYWKH